MTKAQKAWIDNASLRELLEKQRFARPCAGCDTDIGYRHFNAKRCEPCARVQERELQKERDARKRRARARARASRVCVGCHTSLAKRRADTQRCFKCAAARWKARRKARR